MYVRVRVFPFFPPFYQFLFFFRGRMKLRGGSARYEYFVFWVYIGTPGYLLADAVCDFMRDFGRDNSREFLGSRACSVLGESQRRLDDAFKVRRF